MEFHFSSLTWYHVEHYKGNSISVCTHVLFSMWQAGKEIMIIMIVIVKGMRKKKKKKNLAFWFWRENLHMCEKIHGTCIGREMLKRLKTKPQNFILNEWEVVLLLKIFYILWTELSATNKQFFGASSL